MFSIRHRHGRATALQFCWTELVPVSFSGPAHIVRKTVTEVMLFSEHPAARNLSKGQMIFILKSLYVNYSTAHYNGVLFRGSPLGDLLDATGAKFRTPLTAAERQNPRLDDKFLTQRLITHLNQNLEYYNRVLWTSLDSNRRFMLLDGFKIETFVSGYYMYRIPDTNDQWLE